MEEIKYNMKSDLMLKFHGYEVVSSMTLTLASLGSYNSGF
jgi:hypothetical protein